MFILQIGFALQEVKNGIVGIFCDLPLNELASVGWFSPPKIEVNHASDCINVVGGVPEGFFVKLRCLIPALLRGAKLPELCVTHWHFWSHSEKLIEIGFGTGSITFV